MLDPVDLWPLAHDFLMQQCVSLGIAANVVLLSNLILRMHKDGKLGFSVQGERAAKNTGRAATSKV